VRSRFLSHLAGFIQLFSRNSTGFAGSMPIMWIVNTIGSHTSLGDLISWNTPSQPDQTQTTVQTAQATLNQSPTQIVSALAPSNSYYGVAPTDDSLLGNIGTSAALNALSQINATRSASDQISPYGSGTDATSDAIADAEQAQQSSKSTVLAGLAGLNGGSANAIPSEYYVSQYPAILSTLAPQLTFS
jgi:hypothetical protein